MALHEGHRYAHEPLGNDPEQRRRGDVGLDPHLIEPGKSGGRVVGVDGRQDVVTGQGRSGSNRRGFSVPDLTHHHDVRIEPEHGPQATCEGQARLGVDRDLGDAGNRVLDRVLDGDELALDAVDLRQRGVERRGLA